MLSSKYCVCLQGVIWNSYKKGFLYLSSRGSLFLWPSFFSNRWSERKNLKHHQKNHQIKKPLNEMFAKWLIYLVTPRGLEPLLPA